MKYRQSPTPTFSVVTLTALQRCLVFERALTSEAVLSHRRFPKMESCNEAVQKVFSEEMSSEAERSKQQISQLVQQFGQCPGDTGSTPVQIAILTFKIKHQTEHVKRNRKDYCCQRSLVQSVHQRRRLLRYLQRTDYLSYQHVLQVLALRAPKEQHYPSVHS